MNIQKKKKKKRWDNVNSVRVQWGSQEENIPYSWGWEEKKK